MSIEAAALSLFEIARSGDVTQMFALLRRHPTIWQSKDAEGCTALHAAAAAGGMDMGQLLVHAGASVREADNDGWEPLHYACANNDLNGVKALMLKGASNDIKDNNGHIPVAVPTCRCLV